MQELISFLSEHLIVSFILSMIINVLISVIGFLPSTILTTINVKIFGVKEALYISFLGETIGTIFSFWIYRKGYSAIHQKYTIPKFLSKFESTSTKKAFMIILLCRLNPLIPSSIVTLFAAISSITFGLFFLSSTLGKIPAILIEVFSMNFLLSYMNFTTLFLILLVFVMLFPLLKKVRK